METRKIYKCFISSPGDCNPERETCQKVIDEVNSGLANHFGINFETFKWESDVLPDMGLNGQEIIDEHIEKSNYDIFIGIMKHRFGHPTKKAGSGTEHEFFDALNRKKSSIDKLPQILFFFGKEKVDPETLDFEQFQKVKNFKKSISSEGLYIDYDETNFESALKSKLELFVQENSLMNEPKEKFKEIDNLLKQFEEDLKNALRTYNEDSPLWIDPIISTKRSIPINPTKNDENRIDVKLLIDNPTDLIISAPSEFGLTSLGHFLKLEAWKHGKTFVFLDSKTTKKHKVLKEINNITQNVFHRELKNIDCILLDSVCFEENGMMQIIKTICDEFKAIPLIILNTIDNNFFLKSDEDDKIEIRRTFTNYFLLPLPQAELRKIVSSYSNIKEIDEDNDKILSKVTKDLETLNMHRTVKNCISILRAGAKIGNEYNVVNRTKLLETILSSIFQNYELPTYHDKKPDVKDCSFVLGYFSELLVLRDDFEFSNEYFNSSLTEFCKINHIDLDLKYLITVLRDNSIIGVKNSSNNYFKNSYWVFYFIAQRMNMNENFREAIYKGKKYVDYPEIIEFYTGIDRNKSDALKVLNYDLHETIQIVSAKVNIPDTLNPFKSITWNPNVNELMKEEAKISENVITSGLPDEIKDKYDDKQYNQKRPYNQVINTVMRDYSFLILMRQVAAASRALRNSDFVNDPELKEELLKNITNGWNELNKLLIVLSPLLADKGKIGFEGANFRLDEEYLEIQDPIEKRFAVLQALPTNVVRIFKDDLFSTKMGPLLIHAAQSESNSLLKHELMLLLIAERPKKWRETIDNYIVSLDKNSFYLADVLQTIDFNIDFKATEVQDVLILKQLSKKCRAKHYLNDNNPSLALINRLDKLEKGGKF